MANTYTTPNVSKLKYTPKKSTPVKVKAKRTLNLAAPSTSLPWTTNRMSTPSSVLPMPANRVPQATAPTFSRNTWMPSTLATPPFTQPVTPGAPGAPSQPDVTVPGQPAQTSSAPRTSTLNTAPITASAPAKPRTYADYINEAFKAPEYQKALSEYNAMNDQAPNYAINKQRAIISADANTTKFTQAGGDAMAELYSAPAKFAEQYKDIKDPTQRNALIAQAVGNIMGRLKTNNDFLAQRQSTATDLANQSAEVFKAQLSAKGDLVKSMQDSIQKQVDRDYTAQEKRDYYLFTQRNKASSGTTSSADKLMASIIGKKWVDLGKVGIVRKQKAGGGFDFYQNGQPVDPALLTQQYPGLTMTDLVYGSKDPQDKKWTSSSQSFLDLIAGAFGGGATDTPDENTGTDGADDPEYQAYLNSLNNS